jgi:hypothetical protein
MTTSECAHTFPERIIDLERHRIIAWICPLCFIRLTSEEAHDMLDEARRARDIAIAQVDRNADEAWKKMAFEWIVRTALVMDTFISADVRSRMKEAGIEDCRELRAWGPVYRRAADAGHIVASDRTQQSYLVVDHARPQRVWISKIKGSDMTTATKIPTFTLDQAVAIINEAKGAGAMREAMPEDEEKKFSKAREIVDMALGAYEKGSANPAIRTILSLARLNNEDAIPDLGPKPDDPKPGDDLPPEPAPEPSPLPEPSSEPESVVTVPNEVAENNPDRDPPVPGGRQRVIERAEKLGLPVPQSIAEKDVDPMPRDVTTLDDRKLRAANSEWHGVYSYAAWNLALEEADMMATGHLLDAERNAVMVSLPKTDPETGKPKLAGVIQAEIEQATKGMADQHFQHQVAVKGLKSLTAIYQGNVDRLSREITARQAEFERAHAR